MTEDLLRYDLMIEAALRDVVREALETAARDGLPGEHHFYITFLTKFPGVEIPDYLHKQYPEEMTIVLQFQFFGLKVQDDKLSVTLSFNNVKETLIIPIDAITTFADPSVNFALQFQNAIDDDDEDEDDEDGAAFDDEDGADAPAGGKKGKGGKVNADKDGDDAGKRGEVISLDKFRKK